MDKLPVELLTLIAFFACTDGGPTGCALALVSKHVRAAARPARFFSVCIFGSPIRIEQFLLCYQAERTRAVEGLPRVRHLCLSLFGKGLETPDGPSPSQAMPSVGPSSQPAPCAAPPPASRAEFFAAMQRRTQQWRSAQDALDEQYNRVVPALIRAVAPDVRTLALVQAQWRSASVVRCAFPSLRELTLVGGDPSFLPFAFAPAGRPLYPALLRLHHILAFVGRDVDFTQWAQHAPNLTHLRVSRLGAQPRITLDTLDQVVSELLGVSDLPGMRLTLISVRASTDEEAGDDFFPRLQHAMVQPHPAPPPGLTGENAMANLVFRDFLAHLQRIAERAKVPMEVLPPLDVPNQVSGTVDPYRRCIMRVKREWMERIEADGAGCWEEGRRHAVARAKSSQISIT